MIYTETPENNGHNVFCFHQIGQQHLLDGMECEDVSLIIERDSYCFYGLADGQSGKKYCRDGGKAVLTAVSAFLEGKGVHCLNQYEYTDELQYELIRVIRGTISSLSDQYQADSLEFSSTIVGFAADYRTGEYITVHIGDGAAIAISCDGSPLLLSAPENGITNYYTWLTTSRDAMHHMRIRHGNIDKMKRIVMVTDGATMICRGKEIAKKAEPLLIAAEPRTELENAIRSHCPQDDASCILADLR